VTGRRLVTVALLVEGDPAAAAEFGQAAANQLVTLAGERGLRVHHHSWDARPPTREQNLALTPRKTHLADPRRPQQGVCGCFTARKLRTDNAAAVTCRLCQLFMQRHPVAQRELPFLHRIAHH
jgi:hypothetical protein